MANDDYVAPPTQKAEDDYVKPVNTTEEEYVKPVQSVQDDYVAPPQSSDSGFRKTKNPSSTDIKEKLSNLTSAAQEALEADDDNISSTPREKEFKKIKRTSVLLFSLVAYTFLFWIVQPIVSPVAGFPNVMIEILLVIATAIVLLFKMNDFKNAVKRKKLDDLLDILAVLIIVIMLSMLPSILLMGLLAALPILIVTMIVGGMTSKKVEVILNKSI